MNVPLLSTALGLFFILVAIERLAARALRMEAASWHAHYASIPATATIMAGLRWKQATWVTAYVDPTSDGVGSLQVVALRPLSSAERRACLSWLHAEGFADASICRAGDEPNRWSRESNA